MTTAPEKPKPRAWRKSQDPAYCIGCEQAFRYRDKIYDIGGCALHADEHCIKKYVRDCRELGIKP